MDNGFLIAFGVFVIVFVAALVGYAGLLFARGHRVSKERELARRRSFDAAMKRLEDIPAAPGPSVPARHVAAPVLVEDRGTDIMDAVVTAVVAEEIISGLDHSIQHQEPAQDGPVDSSGWSAHDQGSTSTPDPAASFDPGSGGFDGGSSFGGDGGSF